MADTTKDRSDLKERAANELGISGNQALEQEDDDTLDNLIDPLIAQLSVDGVVTIDDTEAIETKYFLPLARLLANEAAPSFGQQRSEDVKFANEKLLRKLTAARPTLERQKAVYY